MQYTIAPILSEKTHRITRGSDLIVTKMAYDSDNNTNHASMLFVTKCHSCSAFGDIFISGLNYTKVVNLPYGRSRKKLCCFGLLVK